MKNNEDIGIVLPKNIKEGLKLTLDNLKASIDNDEKFFEELVTMCMQVGKYQIGKNIFSAEDFDKIVYIDDIYNIIKEAYPNYYEHLQEGIFLPFKYTNEIVDIFCNSSSLTTSLELQSDDLREALEREILGHCNIKFTED